MPSCAISRWFRHMCDASDPVLCEGCNESFCKYHGQPAGLGRVQGGHTCKRTCSTSAATQQMCEGRLRQCQGCQDYYCEYHAQQGAYGRIQGGHVCRNSCSTSIHTRQNCKGSVQPCAHCNENYCKYHWNPVQSVTEMSGGHNCPKVTNGYWVAAAGDAVSKAAIVAGGAAVAVATAPASASTGMVLLAGAAGAKRVKDSIDGERCATSTHFRHMCSGPSKMCSHCKEWFCEYHCPFVENVLTATTKGHSCSVASKGGLAVNVTQIIAENSASVATAYSGGAEAIENFGAVRTVTQTGIAQHTSKLAEGAEAASKVEKALRGAKDVTNIVEVATKTYDVVSDIRKEVNKGSPEGADAASSVDRAVGIGKTVKNIAAKSIQGLKVVKDISKEGYKR